MLKKCYNCLYDCNQKSELKLSKCRLEKLRSRKNERNGL